MPTAPERTMPPVVKTQSPPQAEPAATLSSRFALELAEESSAAQNGEYPREPFYMDLRPFLPSTWDRDLEQLLAESSHRVKQVEGGAGSLGYKEAGGVDYAYLMRGALASQLPWTDYLHRELLPVLLGLQGFGGLQGDPRTKRSILPIAEEHGIIANLYNGDRKGIEWHRDGADVWLNILLPTRRFSESTGGCLQIHDGRAVKTYEFMTPGVGLVALTGDFPHVATPLTSLKASRSVLLFSYTNEERQPWREQAYDNHFYPTNVEAPAP
jgi:hypothetical protein